MFYLYIIIIFLCIVCSLINKYARQRLLYIYFFVVFISELLVFNQVFSSDLYKITKITYIFFFLFTFRKETENKLFLNSLLISSFLLIIIILFKSRFYGLDLSLLQSFIYLLISLNWFAGQIKNPNEIKIYKKMSFWISVGIKLWTVTYLLRIIPANYFVENDEDFFILTNNIYQYSTIITYIIFLKGLFCKV